MKPSAEAILSFLIRRGGYVTSTEIVRNCYTTTVSKRISELRKAGLIETRQHKGAEKEYRARTMDEILLNERRSA
jgi:uncharacterized membrane protein